MPRCRSNTDRQDYRHCAVPSNQNRLGLCVVQVKTAAESQFGTKHCPIDF